MLEKTLETTPNLSKLLPFFDICGETMCSYTTNRDRSTFLNMQRTRFQVYAIFSVPKFTSRNTPETRKPLFPQHESQKFQFLEFFRLGFMMAKRVSARKTNYFSQADISYESKGYSLTNK